MMQTKNELDKRLVRVVPSDRQLSFQQMEFYAFVHFTVNTFTDQEWGNGTENPAIFNPTKLDPEQWVLAIKDAEMKGLILTCKHHDGFCLWPSKLTKHTVEYSPLKRDVVKETAQACRKHGIKFGVYLSPWDRNCKLYGQGKAYDDFFVGQLEELLTNYGDVFCVWFDGACGEGENGKKQYYDWDRYYETIRKLQPGACINVCGPDIRWCGNEAGHTRPAEWSVVPARTRDTEKIAENSQKEDNAQFRQRKISAWDQDLGSRNILADEKELVWYPAEVNTSIRPGWFWHESENDKVRSLKDLISVYDHSVGGNATFLLNIPPTSEGLFHEKDVERLHEIGEYLRKTYAENMLEKEGVSVTAKEEGTKDKEIKSLLLEDNYVSHYQGKGKRTVIQVSFPEKVNIGHIVLKENILQSQRVEKFHVEAAVDGRTMPVYQGSIIGYKKIIPFAQGLETDSVCIVIEDSREEPTLAFLGIYEFDS